MFTQILSATLKGVEAVPIQVETELSLGLPGFSIIGLADKAVQEARFRIHSALRASELELPFRRITLNLAPAALPKDGAALDLPMTLSLLAAAELIPASEIESSLALGELSLSGRLRPVSGVLPATDLARRLGLRRIFVPEDNAPEANSIKGIEIVPVPSLKACTDFLSLGRTIHFTPRTTKIHTTKIDTRDEPDLVDVKGQSLARRALEIAAAGEHNLLLLGSPGGGKTMIARRLPSILPALSVEDRVEVTKIWSSAGLTIGWEGLVKHRPFRSPHHSVSSVGLVGGGTPIRPGEVSLAHHGILFLDEMLELNRHVLEGLRQPLEDREVVIVRARESIRLPARFMLVGAANPCPCGWYGHSSGRCRCTDEERIKYQSRISGPLLDRIDLVVETPSLSPEELLSPGSGEPSSAVQNRVTEAQARAKKIRGAISSRLSGRVLREKVCLSKDARNVFVQSVEQLELSARAMERTLRVAQTIADLAGSEVVGENAILEALHYRPAFGTR